MCVCVLDTYRRNDKDARRKTSLTKYLLLTLFVTFAKGYSRFSCERELETEQKLQYSDSHSYGHQRCVFLVLLMLKPNPWGPTLLDVGFLYCILSAFSLDPNSIGGPEPLRSAVAFLTTSRLYLVRSLTATPWLLSWLSYIIFQRPLSRLLDFWNRMLDHHHAVHRSLSSGA